MPEWLEYAKTFFDKQADQLWIWFDGLNRQEWMIVMACCCAAGFFMMKSWGRRGPC